MHHVHTFWSIYGLQKADKKHWKHKYYYFTRVYIFAFIQHFNLYMLFYIYLSTLPTNLINYIYILEIISLLVRLVGI